MKALTSPDQVLKPRAGGQESLPFLRDHNNWPALSPWLGTRDRPQRRQRRRQVRYYLSSLPHDAEQLLNAVRGHWGIENALHWLLDFVLREDDSHIRKHHGPQNMVLLRRIALNLLKQEKPLKRGIKLSAHSRLHS